MTSSRIAALRATAFLASELVDSWFYARLRARGRVAAMAGPYVGGLVVDSAVFVPFAFGSLALLPGQLAGKALTTAVARPCCLGGGAEAQS